MVEVLERERQYVPSFLDAVGAPDDTAWFVAIMTPGAQAVSALAAVPVEALSAAGRIDALVALRRQQSWLAAREHLLLAAMVDDARTHASLFDEDGECWLAEEVSCALRLATVTAEGRLLQAADLVRRLPATLDLLEGGEISPAHARVLSDETLRLNDSQVTAVEAQVIARAPEQTIGEFRRTIRRAVKTVDSRREEQRHAEAVADRRVAHTARDDGLAEIWALLPADGARILMAGLNKYAADCAADDPRTADQRRADALVE